MLVHVGTHARGTGQSGRVRRFKRMNRKRAAMTVVACLALNVVIFMIYSNSKSRGPDGVDRRLVLPPQELSDKVYRGVKPGMTKEEVEGLFPGQAIETSEPTLGRFLPDDSWEVVVNYKAVEDKKNEKTSYVVQGRARLIHRR